MHMFLKGLAGVFLLTVLFSVAGCGAKEKPRPIVGESLRTVMVGKKWMVDELFARRMNEDVSLEFMSDGGVKLFGGCNEMAGTYTLVDDALQFGSFSKGGQSCGPSLDEQEYSIKVFLARVEKVQLDGDDLLLLSREFPEPIRLTSGGGGLFW